ncbi:MAG: hypothetical protein QXK47_05495 [Candidatus Bathyarchaeia archaeon]
MSSSDEKVTVVLQKNAQPFRLTLIRGQKGGYGWRVDVSAESRDELLYNVDMIDTYLRGRYLSYHSEVGTLKTPNDSSSTEPFRRMEQALENIKKVGEKPRPLTERV